jgi:hypothetical protein
MMGKQLEDVPGEHNFRLNDGREIKNLYDLGMHLAAMDDSTFSHHVNDDRNDFKSWVFQIVKDDKLADRFSKAKDRKNMAKMVKKRVKELEMEKRHHEKVVEHGFKWGVKEFGIGLVTGLFIAFVFFTMTGML